MLVECISCGAEASIRRSTDADGLKWAFVQCTCGRRSEGQWYSQGNDCPIMYEEVREEWNALNSR